jgi:hypothetical protein
MRTGDFDGHYIPWRKSRIAVTLDYYGDEYFNGKKLLEVGAGWGDVGNEFSKLGAIVTVSDAREEHMYKAKLKHPNLTCLTIDSENTTWQYPVEIYDMIIHWGTLYHLKNPKENIELFSKHCKEMVLETIVADSLDPDYIILKNEEKIWENGAWGSAYSGIGCLPGYAYVEKCLTDSGFDWKRMENPKRANAAFHYYDWKRENNKKYKSGQRAFWFCKNNNNEIIQR